MMNYPAGSQRPGLPGGDMVITSCQATFEGLFPGDTTDLCMSMVAHTHTPRCAWGGAWLLLQALTLAMCPLARMPF